MTSLMNRLESPKPLQQACDSCRLRKMKCSKHFPTCTKCKEHNWKCVYSPKSVRSPLTRAYLTKIETKAANLEKLLKRMLPEDVEVQDLLRMIENEDKQLDDINLTFKQVNLTPEHLNKMPLTLKSINDMTAQMANDASQLKKSKPMEKQPEDYLINIKNSDLNYFDERDNTMSDSVYDSSIDGMAALSNDTGLRLDVNFSNGYFGINSSNGLLKFLQLKSETNGNSIIELNLDNQQDFSYENEYILDDNINRIWSDLNGSLEDLLENQEFQLLMVSVFFEKYYQVYPIINKKRFFRNYETMKHQSEDLDDHKVVSFLVLLNTILAIGVWCMFGENSKMHSYFYQKVKDYCLKINLFEYSDTQLLDSFVLLSNYVQKTNKPNTGWNYLGLATRIATSLGLHKEVKIDRTLDTEVFEDLEIRKRQWWGMYFFDVGTTLTFGRPLTIPPLTTIDLGPVKNIDDNLLNKVPLDQVTVSYPTIYTTLIYESELTKISTRIYNYNCSVLKLSNDKSKMIGLLDMNELLMTFVRSLPVYYDEDEQKAKQSFLEMRQQAGYNDTQVPQWFALSRLRLIARYKNLQILIFRYIIWETKDASDITHYGLVKKCKSICFNASIESLYVVCNFVDNNLLDYLTAWYATYFLFQAILIPILQIIINQTTKEELERERHQNLLKYIEMSQNCFQNLRKYNKLAGKFIRLIDVLLGKDTPQIDQWNISGLDDIFDANLLDINL